MDAVTTRLTLNAVACAVVIFADERLLFCNPAAERLLGCHAAALPPLRAIIHPDFQPLIPVWQTMPPAEPVAIILQPAGGAPLWVDFSAVPVEFEGQPALLATIIDRSAARQTESALRQREAHLRLAIEAACAGVWDMNLLTGQTTWSDEDYRLLGYVPGSVQPSFDNWLRVIHPDDRDTVLHMHHMTAAQKSRFSYEYRVVWPDGSIHWVHDLGETLCDPAGNPERIIGLALDITERKRAEEALRVSEWRLKLALTAANAGTWFWDVTRNITYWSDENFRLMGYEPGSCVPGYETWIAHVFPEDLAVVTVTNVLVETGLMRSEYRVVWPDGSVHWVLDLGKTLFDAEGHPESVMGIKLDITERKQMEAALLEQARLRAELQREQELGLLKTRLMERISHEFRTPITIIATSTELLDRYFDRLTAEKRREHLNQIWDEIAHLKRMMDDLANALQGSFHLLDFSPAAFNLEALCYELAARTRQATGINTPVQVQVEGDLKQFVGDRQRVETILSNLLANALKYSPEGVPVRLLARRDAGSVVLAVSDRGAGISLEDQQHIFEPFFRSASSRQTPGLGLGLRIAQDAAAAHGGTITVESAVGQGTTFTVRLPLQAAALAKEFG